MALHSMTLIKNARVDGVLLDVRVGLTIEGKATHLPVVGDEYVVDARRGELLPGFHDHHLHFMASAAAMHSVDCGPPQVNDMEQLGAALAGSPADGWVRGVGYHESVAGNIDRWVLDELDGNRPLRIQHRSGKMWVFNTPACERLNLAAHSDLPGIERDASGGPTGRVFRLDGWLRERLDGEQEFGPFSQHIAKHGITSFTDASYTNDIDTFGDFCRAREVGSLRQKFELMGDASLETGYRKIMLDDDALPSLSDLIAMIGHAHDQDRNVAFHCVSRTELVFALSALGDLPSVPGDRIEHGAVVHDDMLDPMLQAQVTLVTQPGFLIDRGDQYIADLSADQLPYLYRHRSLLERGVPVLVSSDAPYGPVSPLVVAQAAEERRTTGGRVIGRNEGVPASDALSSYFTEPQQLKVRSVELGQPADLCVVSEPFHVTHTFVDGELVYDSSE
jgi:predicted amidohydrolase YtcJ